MGRNITIKRPCQLILIFENPIKGFTIKNARGSVVYSRYLNIRKKMWKVNINTIGLYRILSEHPPVSYAIRNIPYFSPIPMKPFDWNHKKKLKIIRSDFSNSPASIIPKKGVMIINPKMDNYPVYAKQFITAHERGHQYYKQEEDCDLFAINFCMKHGGNLSQCIQTLNEVLKRSPQKKERIKSMIQNYKNIEKHG